MGMLNILLRIRMKKAIAVGGGDVLLIGGGGDREDLRDQPRCVQNLNEKKWLKHKKNETTRNQFRRF